MVFSNNGEKNYFMEEKQMEEDRSITLDEILQKLHDRCDSILAEWAKVKWISRLLTA